jgi:SAM-dependent methyltransferase
MATSSGSWAATSNAWERRRATPKGLASCGVGYCIATPRTRALDELTVRALNAINRDFYRAEAVAFDATRADSWPGWQRVAELAVELGFGDAPDVLDVGCGNGRFGRFLAARLPRLRYLGVDVSPELLAAARARRFGGECRFVQADVVEERLDPYLGARRFHLIALFGVLHHVPSKARRKALLGELAARLRPGGLLALAAWQFETFERFARRVVPWEEYNRGARTPVKLDELEPGDRLLRWGAGSRVRYCHFAGEDEVEEWLADIPCERLDRFRADGREGALNLYQVLRARG